MPGTSFSEIQALGWDNYRDKFEDNIFKSSWGWSRISKRKKLQDGGASITVPLQYATTPVTSLGAYSTISISPTRISEAANFSWKIKGGPVTISDLEEFRNNTEYAKVNLLESRYENLASSMQEDLNGDLYSDGTGTGSLDVTGLAAAVADAPTTGTYGGINRATAGNGFWQNQYYSTSISFATDGVGRMSNLYNNASVGASHPDLIICSQTVLELYEQKLQGVLLLNSNDQSDGDVGFRAFKYKGALMYYDEQCPGTTDTSPTSTGRMYFLNTKFIELWVARGSDMRQTPMQRLPEQPQVQSSAVLWIGQLVFSNCRRQAVWTNIAV